jgi:hypothetical protein
MTRNHTAHIMAQLPEGSLELYGRVAELVLDAWERPELREELVADPAAALERAGIELPTGTSVVVVPPDQAALPGPGRVTLPLPEADAPPTGRAEARRFLMQTDFGWLWGEPNADPARAPRPSRAPERSSAADFLRDLTRWLPGGPVLPQVWIPMGAAIGVVLLAIALRVGPAGDLQGTAFGGTQGIALVVIAGAVGALVAWWLSRE